MPNVVHGMGRSLSGADLIIGLVLLTSTIVGLMRGFIREIAALVFWILGLWAAWIFGPSVEPYLGGYLSNPAVRPWIGRLVVLIVVLFAGYIVGLLLATLLRSAGLGVMDRLVGMLFGMLRGVVLLGILVICGELLHLNHESWWHRSKMIPYGETVGDWLRAMVGEKGEPWAKLERLTGVKVK
ncbi:MAG: CvpA family protein [Steroidobacteraceae bacterium]|jgi:membrane protein required for colicin V production